MENNENFGGMILKGLKWFFNVLFYIGALFISIIAALIKPYMGRK